MNMVAAAVVSLSIARAGTQPSQKGPAEYFTGSVRIDPLFQAKDTTQASGAYVTFEPGANGVACAPARADAGRDGGRRPRADRGRSDRGDPSGRRGLDSAGQAPLARRRADHRDDPPRDPRTPERQGRRVDGKGHRRAVRRASE